MPRPPDPRPIIIDTDPGTDDAIALFLAFGTPGLDVRLVSVTGGNVGLAHTLANARALVGLAGRDMPVVAGADRPLLGGFAAETRVHGETALAACGSRRGRRRHRASPPTPSAPCCAPPVRRA